MRAFVKNGLRFFPNGSKHANLIPTSEYLQPLHSQQIYKVNPVQSIANVVSAVDIETGLSTVFLAKQVVTHLKTY
jgi:hypothetical protein